jgi:hypothetical protein
MFIGDCPATCGDVADKNVVIAKERSACLVFMVSSFFVVYGTGELISSCATQVVLASAQHT